MSALTITLIVIGCVVLLLVFAIIGTYNGLVGCRNSADEAFSTMDVYLKKRWDLIPNLVETVKGYAKHEKDTLQQVIKLRNTPYDGMSVNEKVDLNNQITGAVGRLMALAEAYPDLKANANFQNLSNQLTQIENDIANSRKYYNGAVKNMNNKVQKFPSNIIANMFGFKAYKMFEIASEQRENVQVKF